MQAGLVWKGLNDVLTLAAVAVSRITHLGKSVDGAAP